MGPGEGAGSRRGGRAKGRQGAEVNVPIIPGVVGVDPLAARQKAWPVGLRLWRKPTRHANMTGQGSSQYDAPAP
jgi:hypothetical protein